MSIEGRNTQNSSVEKISLKELLAKIQTCFQYIISRWVLILFFGLSGGCIGFAYAYFKKPTYTATTTFVLEDEKTGGGGLGSLVGLASMAGVDLGGGGGGIFQGDNILELYKSRIMIEKSLLTSLDSASNELLIDRYISMNNLRDQWSKRPDLLALTFASNSVNASPKITRLRDSILGNVVADINRNYLSVGKTDKKLGIIQADVRATDELFAKAFNDAIVKNVNDFYLQTKTKKSLENVRILQQKVDSVRAIMNGAIYSAAAVADATPNLNPTRQAQRIAPVQKAQFSAETNKTILSTLVQNLEMSKITLRKDAPLIQVIDTPIYPLSKSQLGVFKGAFIGGIILVFLIVLFLFGSFMFRQLLNESN